MASEARVPAWKKIGLSIKSEAQVGKSPQPAIINPHIFIGDVRNVPQVIEGVDGGHFKVLRPKEKNTVLGYKKPSLPNTAPIAKKSKISKTEASADKNTEIINLRVEGHEDQLTAKPINKIIASSAPDSLTSRKRKSVNFAPDTKENDGDELQWMAEEVPNVELSTPPKSKAQKMTTSSRSTSIPKMSSTPGVAPISDCRAQTILTYLEDFHKSKVLEDTNTTWKFNKAKEKGVVRYCLEVGENPIIPEAYDDALHAYIKGLQSSFHCTYLRKMALQIRQNDEEDLKKQYGRESKLVESYQKALDCLKTESYKKVLDRQKKRLKSQMIDAEEYDMRQDPAWKFRLLRRQRAEMILNTIPETRTETETETGQFAQDTRDQQLDMSDNARTRVVQTTEVGGKKKRKRKRRTGVPDDDSSSSSSSDSDSDREDSNSAVTQDETMVAESSDENSGSDDDSSEESSSEEDSSEEDSSEENDDSDDNEVDEK